MSVSPSLFRIARSNLLNPLSRTNSDRDLTLLPVLRGDGWILGSICLVTANSRCWLVALSPVGYNKLHCYSALLIVLVREIGLRVLHSPDTVLWHN